MKVFITKYALTKGILEKEMEISTVSPSMVVNQIQRLETYHKPFWYETKEEAIMHAEKLREAKIKSVEKELKKLLDMKF